MTMPEAMKEATHTLLHRGATMRMYDAKHPPPVRDLTNAFDSTARVFRSDSKHGTVSNSHVRIGEGATRTDSQKRALQMQKQKNPWYTHQPSPRVTKTPQLCKYGACPGLRRKNKRKRAFTTKMKCEECSVMANRDMFFCMTINKKDIRNCHYRYHIHKFPNPNNKK